MVELKDIIGKNIGELRRQAGLTQAELAEKINYSDKAVSKWERGDGIPDVIVLTHLAEIFAVDLDWFVHEEHEKPASPPPSAKIRKNRAIITALSVSLIWLIATVIFVMLGIWRSSIGHDWMAFVYAVPLTFVILLVFNSVWGNQRMNYPIISCLLWTGLLTAFSTLLILGLSAYIWMIFILGVPAQCIILLWSGLGKK